MEFAWIRLDTYPLLVTNYLWVYNVSMSLGRQPRRWSHLLVIPLPKPGKDPEQVANYRPITLLSAVVKLMESMIYRRLLAHLNPLPHSQFGFRPARSAGQKAAVFTQVLASDMTRRNPHARLHEDRAI
eukprot:2972338-Amphidinium_carterae.2